MGENNRSEVKKVGMFDTGFLLMFLGILGVRWLGLVALGNLFNIVGIGTIAYHCIDKYALTNRKKYELLFKNCSLVNKDEQYPQLKEKKKTNYGYALRFSLPYGLSSGDFIKHENAIAQQLDENIKIKYAHKNIILEVYQKQLEKQYDFEGVKTKGELQIPVGYSYGRKLVTLDLKEAIHTLIAGETDSGKSTLLRNIITYLILYKNVNLYLIDLKGGTEFKMFEKCKQVKACVKDKEKARMLLQKIYAKVEKRNTLFYENDCIDIYEYNDKAEHKLKHEVVIIDEFVILRKDKKGSVATLETLAGVARSTGIHLIISTQRPDANVISGLLKANFPSTIGLKTHDAINSKIIIDHKGLEELRGYGHAILKVKSKEIEMQSIYLNEVEARNLLKPHYAKKKETVKSLVADTKTKSQGVVQNLNFLNKLKGGDKK